MYLYKFLLLCSYMKIILTSVLWKADTKMYFGDFFLKEIFFIEKQDNGGGGKVLVITDTVEQMKAFMHSVLFGLKHENV